MQLKMVPRKIQRNTFIYRIGCSGCRWESRCYYNSIDHYSFNNRHGLSLARKPRFTICRFGRCAFPGSDGGCLDSREFVENIVIGLVITASLLWCGSATSPMLTAIAKSVGIDLGTSSMLISSFAATSMIQSYLVFIAFAYKPIIGFRSYCWYWQVYGTTLTV